MPLAPPSGPTPDAQDTHASGLFYKDLIATYLDGPGTIGRDWLLAAVQDRLGRATCRYVLLTGEPGAGKTGIVAAFARARPDWLRYFIRSDSVSPLSAGDAVSAMLRLGHQLAHYHPEIFDPELLEIVVRQRIEQAGPASTVTGVRIDDLKVSPFYRTAIRVQQEVGALAGGLVGVEISQATGDPRLLEPNTLSQLALLDPATALARRAPDATIVVLVDALDELFAALGTTTILDWLETGPQLPSNLRFVLTSRPHDRLRTLQGIREGQVEVLRIEEFTEEVASDVRLFAALLFDDIGVLQRRPAIDREAALDGLSRAANGNFAYLAAYARSLRAAIVSGSADALDELLGFQKLPDGLYSLYATFVRRIRRQVESLGQLEIYNPRGTADGFVPAWEGAGQRIMAVLAVAQAPLTLDQLTALGAIRVWNSAVGNVLQFFVPFLDEFSGAWQFFHSSVGEFLRSADPSKMGDVAVNAREWNTRIVRHYRGGAEWSDVQWQDIDNYGLLHIAEHLAASDPDPRAIGQLVTFQLRRAMKARFHSDTRFLRVVERAQASTQRTADLRMLFAETAFLDLVRSGLSAGASTLDPAVYGLMARLGRVEEALARVEVLAPGLHQYRSLEAICESTREGLRTALGRLDGTELLEGAALQVPSAGQRLFSGLDRQECLRDAAVAMAPHSLQRALRLCELIEQLDDRIKSRDAVLRAAAIAAPNAAVDLIAAMTSGRAAAAARAAERAAGNVRHALTALARAQLSAEGPAERISICALVLVLTESGGTAFWRDELCASLDQLSPGEKTSYEGWGPIVAKAARTLHGVMPDLAACMLTRCEPDTVESSTDWIALMVADSWADWGCKEACVRVLEKALDFYRGLGWYGPAKDIARVATIAAKIDSMWGEQLAQEAIGLVAGVADTAEPIERGRLDGILAGVIDAFRPWDRARALQVAQWSRGNWIHGGPWNSLDGSGSALAVIGLDAADQDPGLAAKLLAKCLEGEETQLTLGPPDPALIRGQLFTLERPTGTGGSTLRTVSFIAYVTNVMNYWSEGRNRRIFTCPADVLHSLEWPFFPRASWARAVIAAIAPVGQLDLDRAITLAFRPTDPCDSFLALAQLVLLLADAGDERCTDAARLFELRRQSLPDYISEIDLDKLEHQKSLLLFLNPSVKARVEVALHLLQTEIGQGLIESAGSDYAEFVWRSEWMVRQFWSEPGERLLTPAAREINDRALARIANIDPLVGDLVRLAYVHAIVSANTAAAREELPKFKQAHYRASAELACICSENPVGSAVARCVEFLSGLDEQFGPLHRANLVL